MAKKSFKTDKSQRGRILFLMAVLGVLCFVGIFVRLVWMQVFRYDFYLEKALSQQTADKVLYPVRGTIYDAKGKPLAISASTEMVTLEAKKIDSEEQGLLIAEGLSEILGLEYEEVLEKVQKKASWAMLKRGVEKDEADAVRAFVKEHKLDSVYLSADSTRYYPYGSFLSHVLGFVGTDEQGLGGLESYYDDVLTGTEGRVVTSVSANGTELAEDYEIYYPAQDGKNLNLTIDVVLQQYLEKNLEIAYRDNNVAEHASGIVIDVKTGAILAMAGYPDFDPNEPFTITSQSVLDKLAAITDPEKLAEERSKALYAQWRNNNISYTYSPGSTFKTITASAALEEGTLNTNTSFYCPGFKYVDNWGNIRCWKHEGHGSENLFQAVQNSCNPAFMTIGEALGKENLKKYVEAFGLLNKTGIDLPGESLGMFNLNSNIDLAVYSFGQNFTVTPLQMISAIGAVANGGSLMQPYVVSSITDANGTVVESFAPTVQRQVMSARNSELMREILESVVTVGTGKNAYIAGYHVAGKTGTTEKIDKQNQIFQETGKEVELRIASFYAFAPADDPQIAILILLDEPNVDNIGGGTCVAPAVRRFLEEALPYLNVDPTYTEAELAVKDVTMPDITGMTIKQAEAAMKKAGISYRVVGSD
ncbi:MAG: PASTA domain-containing protein, partial [Clostridia bacterium]|nr:PASTA domain-containing protein [Clostridia bacterium]